MEIKKRHKEKIQFNLYLQELLDKEYYEKNWTANDAFDIACWFMNDILLNLALRDIVPFDEFKKRVKQKINESLDDALKQIKKAVKE